MAWEDNKKWYMALLVLLTLYVVYSALLHEEEDRESLGFGWKDIKKFATNAVKKTGKFAKKEGKKAIKAGAKEANKVANKI